MRSVLKNLKKLDRRLSEQDFVAKPSRGFLRDWSSDVKKEAIERAPDWRGRIIRSLMENQDSKKFPLWARVFSDVPEARWMEYGTGLLSEDPKSTKQRYFPPWSEGELRDWSMSKDLDPFSVAFGIYTAGGTPPTHFFSDAERAADARLNAKLIRFGRAIEIQAGIEP